ncbi:hypothetical protein C0416_00515 [bacterium]|nr:hypothetical protein [bacterium]
MKALSKVALLGLVAGLFVTATGCGEEGLPSGKSPEDVIKAALLNQGEITKSVFEMNMTADLKGEVDGEQNSLKGTFSISGTQDEEKMSMKMNVDGSMNKDSAKGDIELRVNKDGVFALVSGVKVSDEATQGLIDTMLKDYMGEWVMLSFVKPAEVLESGQMTQMDYSEGDDLPFTNIQYKGTADMLGVKSYHFTADIDEEMLLGMVEAADMADTQAFLDAATMTGDVYVAVNEMVLTGFSGTMKLTDPEMNGNVEISYKLNPTKSDDVKTPDYKKTLTEEDIAMLMFGGAVTDPTATDYTEFDDAAMMDYDLEGLEGVEGMEGFESMDTTTLE